MQKTIFLSCFLFIITTLNVFCLGNQETQHNSPKENSAQVINDQGQDYEKIAAKLSVNIDDLINAFEESDSGASLDLKTIATKLNVTERELSDAMSPPPRSENGQDSQPHPKSSGKIFSSLITEYENLDFEINSLAIEHGELIDAYKCEKKINNKEKSIPLSWSNIPEGTKSLAILMYHYPNPNDKTNSNSYLLLWGIDPTVQQIAYGEADSGAWYMGQNKDGNAISYTSPCSQGKGIHEYIISIFALTDFPELLPEENSLNINFDLFMTAIENVKILGRADLVFKAITE